MHPRELAARFSRGENITSLLKAEAGTDRNSEEIIETAYDLQAGSYIEALSDPDTLRHKQAYAARLAHELASLGPLGSLLECGVGEATTLGLVLDAIAQAPQHVHGFDLSWPRVAGRTRTDRRGLERREPLRDALR